MTTSEKTLEQIIRAHKKCGGKVSEAARQLQLSEYAIRKCWKQKGLKSRNTKIPYKTEQEIIKAYAKYNGIATHAARHMGISLNTIVTYWRRQGFPIHRRGNILGKLNIPYKTQQKIKRAYKKYDGCIRKAARHLPVSHETVRKYWKKDGLI